MKKCMIPVLLIVMFFITAPIQAQQTLKIGALVTISGAGASWGQNMLRAAELAAEDANSQGGLKVNGTRYKVKIIAYDDAYKSNEAVTAANRLVYEDKVKYIVGTVGSAPILAIQPITETNGVITLTLGFTSKALAPAKPFTFRPNLTTTEVSQPQINWVVKTKRIKTVGALFPNDETGQQIAKDVAKAYRSAGAKMRVELFGRERVDFIPLLTRLIAADVDAIELDGNSPVTAGQIVQQARDIGFEGIIIRTGGPATQDIVNVAGKAAEGMYVHSGINPELKGVADYQARYEKTYNAKMNGFSPYFFDGVNMLFKAMQTAGTVTDSAAVRDALAATRNYKGILGTLNWSGKERYGIAHQIDAPFYVAQVKNGQEVIVARCSIKSCQ